MQTNEPTQALDSSAQPATVVRYAVILRDGRGKAELLGQLHATEGAAEEMGRYWQSTRDEAAEVVAVTVSLKGKPITDGRDLFSTGGKADE